MTHEEFAHICLKIKSGDTSIEVPCCANCKYYKKHGLDNNWSCFHTKLETDDPYVWCAIQTKPEDFCSRWEARDV